MSNKTPSVKSGNTGSNESSHSHRGLSSESHQTQSQSASDSRKTAHKTDTKTPKSKTDSHQAVSKGVRKATGHNPVDLRSSEIIDPLHSDSEDRPLNMSEEETRQLLGVLPFAKEPPQVFNTALAIPPTPRLQRIVNLESKVESGLGNLENKFSTFQAQQSKQFADLSAQVKC